MTDPRPDLDLIHGLADRWWNAVRTAVGGPRAALLDFPGYRNVGDSLIWAGTRRLLPRAGVEVTYVCEKHGLRGSALRRCNGDAPIMLSGGGNFGDVWPDFQRFREEVAAQFPRQRIVQLPQSLWYDHPERAVPGALAAHPDLELMVRDRRSRELASSMFPAARVSLVPDAAFGLGPLRRTAPVDTDILCLVRADRESRGYADEFRRAGLPVTDWGTHRFSRRAWKAKRRGVGAVRRAESGATAPLTQPVLRSLYSSMARQNLDAGVRTFSAARVVVTDRLHGHVLCLLLGIPHVVLDNSYGKIRDFREAWTSGSELTRTAATADEAVDLARELLGSPLAAAP
ncbi:polysaccharide pyruvyl transferase family protein [Kineococcus sp. G2]|uniref:polysaccharide pyruvyl transferase family protein n=1 Tax=Kineococcus sp. G2 TaxID=3127484 RepID=UPI00301D5ED1